jgi:hypothetical protein
MPGPQTLSRFLLIQANWSYVTGLQGILQGTIGRQHIGFHCHYNNHLAPRAARVPLDGGADVTSPRHRHPHPRGPPHLVLPYVRVWMEAQMSLQPHAYTPSHIVAPQHFQDML